MSDQQNAPKKQDLVKPYLGFLDTNVLFKKPVSCLLAVGSLLIPVFFLIQVIQSGLFKSADARFIIGGILVFAVLAFAGVFGALIWWHRRIVRDEGPKFYDNFRRFIQTTGEWFGTTVAIVVFGSVIVLMLVLQKDYYYLIRAIPLSIPSLDFAAALYGPIAGFLIIVATKIFLFLLDPIIWLIKQIWRLFVRIVKFFYRCVVNISGAVEKNTPVWFGVIWLLAVSTIITGLFLLCFGGGGLFPVIALALGLAFTAYLVFKKKNYDS